MDKEDARYQTLEQLHERRKQVVRLHKKAHGIMTIVDMTGLSYPTVRRTIDLYEASGWSAIRPADRGRELGDARLLTCEQEALVRKTICDKRPEQLKMDFCLWSRAAVMQLIQQERGIEVFLILDNLRVHHSKPVKAWLAKHTNHIEVFYLPSYSPELNPEERLNADLKQAMGKKVPVRTKAKLREAANEHMLMIEQSPERVKSFFGDAKVKYAAG